MKLSTPINDELRCIKPNASKHDNIVRGLEEKLIDKMDISISNLEYGWRNRNTPIGEIDYLGWKEDKQLLYLFEIKTSYTKKLKQKAISQTNRMINKFVSKDFKRIFDKKPKKVLCYLVTGRNKNNIDFDVECLGITYYRRN